MRSALALRARADTPQLALACRGRTRVLFSPGGNLTVPGSPGSYYSAIWFSSNTNGMEMKVVGTTLTFVAQVPFAAGGYEGSRNPTMTVLDGRNAGNAFPTVVLRVINSTGDKFAEFGFDVNDLRPYMQLYSANGCFYYVMNAGGTGFDAPVLVSNASMEAQLALFNQPSFDRTGYTVLRMPAGTGVIDGAVQVGNYAIPPGVLTDGIGVQMGLAFDSTSCFLYMFNEVQALTKVLPGVAGALGVTLV